MAAEAVIRGQATAFAFGQRLAPAALIGSGFQHRPAFRVFRHQLLPQGQRILPARLRHFVDEALHVDRVLVGVDAAPKTRRHMGVAHRMVDGEVVKRIADRVIGEAVMPDRQQTLKGRQISAVDQQIGREAGQN